MSSLVVNTTTDVVGSVMNIVGGHQASKAASEAAAGIKSKQDFYDSQLKALMADPSSFFSSPIFTAALKVGQGAVQAQMAASGFNRSSNIMTALQEHAQGFAAQQLLSQEQLLAGLSGAGQNLPAAEGVSVGAQGQNAMELAALAKGAGGLTGSLYGAFGGGGSSADASGLQVVGDNPYF